MHPLGLISAFFLENENNKDDDKFILFSWK